MPDLAAGVAAFGRALRTQGVPVSSDRIVLAARAVASTEPATRDALYWTLRTTLLTARGQVEAFDRIFAAHLDGVIDPADERGDPADQPLLDPGQRAGRPPPGGPEGRFSAGGEALPWVTRTAHASGGGADDGERRLVPAGANPSERLGDRSLASLTVAEALQVRDLVAHFRLATPLRRSRRRRPGRGDRLDLRRTIRGGLRRGGDPVPLARRRRVQRPRRLVLLLDVSASMEAYSRAFLQLLHGAVAGADAEAFVFATRLTRLTRALAGRNPEAALQRAVQAAPDAGGGTRIGPALAAFNDGWGRRSLARGAVVVILSDGWETGDAALVGREMERLARLAHRVVWVNPRAADPRFAALAGGMAAALPHVDELLSGHSATALRAVVEAIGAERAR